MPEPQPSSPQPSGSRLQSVLGHEFFAPQQWKRRIALWAGAILVALAAIVFTKASNWSYHLFQIILGYGIWIPLVITPIVFGLLAWATEGRLSATRGSGIPQVIGTLHIEDESFRQRMLALPVAVFKMAFTLIALMVGASIGREGPTVHVGAGLFYSLGRRFGFTDPKAASRFILAGGAAGIAAAFNTPLAGVIFAIEELAGTFEHRFSGLLLTAVFVGGVVSLGIMGNYSYFGEVQASLPLGHAWLAVLLTGIVCGLLGGLFARLILLSRRGPLAYIGRLRAHAPVLFAVGCGLALAIIGVLSHGSVYGTGYIQARSFVQEAAVTPGESFGIAKLAANVVSYWAGIPGGIFSPALAVGAGLGHNIAHFLPNVPAASVVLLGMSAYLSGVTGAPLTSAVISMELTDNQNMVIPIMAACLLARAAASIFSPTPVYKDFAERMVQDFEHQQAAHASATERARAEAEAAALAGNTSAFDERAAPAEDAKDEKADERSES
ncbi:MAG: chloride channel protein [Rhodanobacter sp.]|uniref:Chloride channel protein n=1 Tax=Rhodanobacter glycinis TaxID=582702 RepID=A0A5B9DYP0_9GAMM|nr:chloride channel protein [Rhodanobacter glycinis]QEE25173.1 chloride channel protein [Rhodanobacter glycinis]TAM30606.1 MAG: chloride channel protein [Rhodanobacter sp.]